MKARTIALIAVLAGLSASPAGAQGTGPSPEAQTAIEHLKQELGTAALTDVLVTDEYTSDHNQVTHVYLRQTAKDGKPIIGAEATVNVQNGEVIFSGHRFLKNRPSTPPAATLLSLETARRLAARAVGAEADSVLGRPLLAYRVVGERTARLAWNVQIEMPHHLWDLALDAQTGRVIARFDNVDHENGVELAARTSRQSSRDAVEAALAAMPPEQAQDGSSYRVFPMPLESPNDGPRHMVFNPADAFASPFGWHDTNGAPGPEHTITRGNNVNAYHDTAAENAADPASQPDGGSGLDFDHPIVTYDATPAAYRDAAVDNLFYWNNLMHDVTFRYGFGEEAGNFQETNYSGQGKGGDAVLAEAQDGSFVLNANFATPADGQPGRMQMFLWVDAFETLGLAPGDIVREYSHQVRDGDLDAGVIAHEYGHGVSNRLVGGPSNVGCLRTHDERQGEGWSDFFGYAMTMRPGDDGRTPRGIGTYVIYQDEGRSARGIRTTPYSTDMRIDPSTFNSIRTEVEPHGVGWVWASMLWDLYWDLVAEHGFNPNIYGSWETGGNNLAIQLVHDGMKMVTCQPGFVDNRDAILAADAALTGDPANDIPGANECLIWRTFARRGLGVSADQGKHTSKTDQTERFDVPGHCA